MSKFYKVKASAVIQIMLLSDSSAFSSLCWIFSIISPAYDIGCPIFIVPSSKVLIFYHDHPYSLHISFLNIKFLCY